MLYSYRFSELNAFLKTVKKGNINTRKTAYIIISQAILAVANTRMAEKKDIIHFSCGTPQRQMREQLAWKLKEKFSEKILEDFIEHCKELTNGEQLSEQYIDVIEYCFSIVPALPLGRSFDMEELVREKNICKVNSILQLLKEYEIIEYYDIQDKTAIIKPFTTHGEMQIDLSDISKSNADLIMVGRGCGEINISDGKNSVVPMACVAINDANASCNSQSKWVLNIDENGAGEFLHISVIPLKCLEETMVMLIKKALINFDKTKPHIDTFIHRFYDGNDKRMS